ncbi:hypothetical protein CTAYLR_001120 [Chrysophaeum taylorii]|uniref:Aminotransferase class I/classII large domain-containing protein n=1 Tax=Chrysophaeum taylorii TaxID=2483200 RepID=A0AAD7UQ12_9STRA|nr:hypothetical protein CTAYLR_001120 [Chrysophaeum taylorii]
MTPRRRLLVGAAGRRASSASQQLDSVCVARLEAMRTAGTLKVEKELLGAQGAKVSLAGVESSVVNLCANNYLGLCDDAEVVEAAGTTLASRGLGNASVRFICGTSDVHKDLERKLSEFHGTEDAVLFPSCFDANAALFEALFGKEDFVASDALNHASIIDGLRLCKARKAVFPHAAVDEARVKLVEAKDARLRAVVTDGVFSMDGDVARLEDLRKAADDCDALLVVDDCHGTGVVGPTGRGTPELAGVKPDILTSTLGKALGGASGGYVASSRAVVSVLKNAGRPYLFSNALAPPLAAAALKALDKVTPSLVTKLRENTHRFRDGMLRAGFAVAGHRDHPIAPVVLGDAHRAKQLADSLFGAHPVPALGRPHR